MRFIFYVFLTILTLSSLAWSQSELGIDVYVGGGISSLAGPQTLRDQNKTGLNASGGVGFHLLPSLSLVVSVDYTSFPNNETHARQEVIQQIPDNERVGAGISISDGGILSIVAATADLKFLLSAAPEQWTPYVVLGTGFLSTSISDVNASYITSDQGTSSVMVSTYHPVVLPRTQYRVVSAFAGSVGIGFDMSLNEASRMFLESRYAVGFTAFGNTTYVPVKLGLRFAI